MSSTSFTQKSNLLQTIGDLRHYMRRLGLSPEQLGKEINISNMTLRRLLKLSDVTQIPERYLAQLERHASGGLVPGHFFGGQTDFGTLVEELEKTGEKADGLEKVQKDVDEKLTDPRIDKNLRAKVTKVFKLLKLGRLTLKQKALLLGALLYLINPLDFIPDTVPIAGYLDDFAVLSLVLSQISSESKKTRDSEDEEIAPTEM